MQLRHSKVKCEAAREPQCFVLQYEDHLLLQVLQGGEQRGLDEAVVMLVVDLSSSHRQNVVVVHAVELDGRLGVALFSLVALFICARGRRQSTQGATHTCTKVTSAVKGEKCVSRSFSPFRASWYFLFA